MPTARATSVTVASPFWFMKVSARSAFFSDLISWRPSSTPIGLFRARPASAGHMNQ